MHQPNKLKLAYHINNVFCSKSGSFSIDGISSITVIASVGEINCHIVYTPDDDQLV
jgi:hypothetical protein